MNDLISKRAAIEALFDMQGKYDEEGYGWIIRTDACRRIDALPSAQPEQQWIPCSERFPEDDTPVLVYLFKSNSPYIAWVSDCEWFTEEFWIEKEYEPKAWMPLPEPYKGE